MLCVRAGAVNVTPLFTHNIAPEKLATSNATASGAEKAVERICPHFIPGSHSQRTPGMAASSCVRGATSQHMAYLLHLLLHGVDSSGRENPLVLDGHWLELWSHDTLHLRLQDWGGRSQTIRRYYRCAITRTLY